ncbi:hypothetical protein AB0F42_23780 [Streptomyces buecherae]|uniref:hypothetical protein n=1 Tax=Streptomyces buecherae TaxID=2763006 RepID=UPI0033E9A655
MNKATPTYHQAITTTATTGATTSATTGPGRRALPAARGTAKTKLVTTAVLA